MKISNKEFNAFTDEQRAHFFCTCVPSYERYWPELNGAAKYSGVLGGRFVRFTDQKGGFDTPEQAIEDARAFQNAVREDLRNGKYSA